MGTIVIETRDPSINKEWAEKNFKEIPKKIREHISFEYEEEKIDSETRRIEMMLFSPTLMLTPRFHRILEEDFEKQVRKLLKGKDARIVESYTIVKKDVAEADRPEKTPPIWKKIKSFFT